MKEIDFNKRLAATYCNICEMQATYSSPFNTHIILKKAEWSVFNEHNLNKKFLFLNPQNTFLRIHLLTSLN